MLLERHDQWIRRQAAWMARKFRVEPEEAYQLIALAMCQGMNRRHARLRALRTLARESRWLAIEASTEREDQPALPSDLELLVHEVLQGWERDLVLSHVIHGITLKASARAIGVNRETARRLYHSAIERLRAVLEAQNE